jgi:RNA polymerase sigma-54 factor
MQMSVGLVQSQRLALRSELLQSVMLMELPIADLRAKIEEELQKNPALEVKEDKSVVSFERLDKKTTDCKNTAYSDGHKEFMEGMLSRPQTLQDYLLWQLNLAPVAKKVRDAGNLIIQNLSNDGFHIEDVNFLLKNNSAKDVQKALVLVQSLDPQGCAATDYKESLIIQARLRFGDKTANEIQKILPYLSDFEKGKFLLATRKTKISEDELEELFEKLKTLSPFPGRQFTGSLGTRYVVPDVSVIRKDDEFKIIINNEEIPVLKVSKSFLDNYDVKKSDERSFIRNSIKDAKLFITSLNRRNKTIFKVSRAIVYYQKDFFEKGPKYLHPLTLRKIAEKLELHETTISRAANGKYMETEWGIFEIRHFFTNAIGDENADFSKGGVKEIIREIITNEKDNLSDNNIVEILKKSGISIARRTVAKYRNELELGSSYERTNERTKQGNGEG